MMKGRDSGPMTPSVGAPRPYFATPAPPTAARRMLLISYFFTPINVIGAIRWHRMTQFAAERGWVVDVVMVDPARGATVDAASAAATDLDKLEDLPPGIALYHVPDQHSWWSSAQRSAWRAVRPLLRRNGSQPAAASLLTAARDSRPRSRLRAAYLSRMHYRDFSQWAAAAARAGSQLAAVRRPDVIISSGPPHSAHEAARRIARSTGIPWVMDMRDPWAAQENVPPDLAGRTWARLTASAEEKCVRAARLVVLNTEASRREIAARYPDLAARFLTVMNGADPIAMPEQIAPSQRFTIAYAGNIYVGRDPATLFRALARVVKDLSLSPDRIGIEFMGGSELARSTVLAAAAKAAIPEFVTVIPRQPHREALAFLARATMLVGLPQYAHLAIPAKVFEYVQFAAWLLILADEGSATEVLFRETGADVVSPSDVDVITERLKQRYGQFCRGDRPVPLNADGVFDRSRQASILFDAIQRIL